MSVDVDEDGAIVLLVDDVRLEDFVVPASHRSILCFCLTCRSTYSVCGPLVAVGILNSWMWYVYVLQSTSVSLGEDPETRRDESAI